MSVRPRVNPVDRKTIRGWRDFLFMNQTEFGKVAAGVSKNTITSWETGRRFPTVTARRRVAEYLATFGIKVEQIIWPAEQYGGERRPPHSQPRSA